MDNLEDIVPKKVSGITWITNPLNERNIGQSDSERRHLIDRDLFFSALRRVFEEGVISHCHYEGVRGKVPSFNEAVGYVKGKCEIDFLFSYEFEGLKRVVVIDYHINRNKMSGCVVDRMTVKGESFEDAYLASERLGFPLGALRSVLENEK